VNYSLEHRNFSILSEDSSLATSILCQFFGTTSIPESSDTLLSKSRHTEIVICFLKVLRKKFIEVIIVSILILGLMIVDEKLHQECSHFE
jgi:hypothetical protein